MISVLVYGRNDSHGYNLHRRAALSFNCIAEVLTEPDDEIVFVDYNTPDELPTFVEAIADTLTDRCLERLRVFRVPAAIHAQRYAERTHLLAIEPIARNAGVRRANPANRWLLSTNTDMIFVPLVDKSLSEICAELPDGFYGLPRFELPEWLWERLPRSDPRRALDEVTRLGPRLRLDEPTLSNEWIRFDAPGDFQLILREDYFAIDGLDEEMLLGYHVDSNLSRRMFLRRGSIWSLEDSVGGYHCNHNREPTVYHGTGKVANDLVRFFVSVERADLPEQRGTWGLPDVELEEVPARERSGTALGDALAAVLPDDAGPRVPSHAARVPFRFTYDTGHVLPFVAESLAVSSPDTAVGYLGVNPVLEELLGSAVGRLGFWRPLQLASFDDLVSVEELAETADVLVIDLGIDASLVEDEHDAADEGRPARFPPKLDLALDALDRLVELERERLEAGEHPRRFVLVHSWTVFWDAFVLANFDCSHSTAHSRVRRATVRLLPVQDPATRASIEWERRMTRWYTRSESRRRRLPIRARETVRISELRDYGAFGEGWSYPDEEGIWTDGTRAELALELDGVGEGDCVLDLMIGSIGVARDGTLTVKAHANGELVAVRGFRYGERDWRIELSSRSRTDSVVDLAFEIEEPTTPVALGWSVEDVRLLGINLRSLTLDEVDRTVRSGETVVFAEGTSAERLLGRGWSHLEPAGVWTDGETASLVLRLPDVPGDAEVVLAVDPFVTPKHPELALEISTGGRQLLRRVFRHGRPSLRRTRARLGLGPEHHLVRVALPVSARDETGRICLDLRFDNPASPKELALTKDDRRLGIHLRWLVVEPSQT